MELVSFDIWYIDFKLRGCLGYFTLISEFKHFIAIFLFGNIKYEVLIRFLNVRR